MTTLAELRQASLKEQKQKEQMQRTPEEASAAEPIPSAVVTPAPAVPNDTPSSGSIPAAAANGSAPPPAANGHHAPVVTLPEPLAPVPSAEAARAEYFFTRLHDSLSHKTLYPSGAKVSADMPPALFHRAKRYCLDNGNITLRQVLIDLLTTYLEEEGY
jgi:hypothetical protein